MPDTGPVPEPLPPALRYAVTRVIVIAALAVALVAMLTGAVAVGFDRSAAQVAVIMGMAAAATALAIPLLLRPRLDQTLGQLHGALVLAASRDSLSGLDNRATLLARADQLWRAARRNQHSFAILFIDGDGFKGINDRHGHAVGDAVIAEVAARMRAVLRAGDMAARMGGDEFAIVLQRVDGRDDALAVAQRLTTAMQPPVALPSGATLSVRLSIGIALYPDDGADVAALMNHADAAMYGNKPPLRDGAIGLEP